MQEIVKYAFEDGIALIRMDDGKVNAMSTKMFEALNHALDKAEADKAITIITGRNGLFSAGFDMKQMAQSAEDLHGVLNAGAELCMRLLSFPMPTIAACNGHAFPMGAFIMMSCDYRIGADGPFRIGMNEVLINMTIPSFAVELARSRLTAAHFNRTTLTGEMFSPEEAVTAGFLDETVAPEKLIDRAREQAEAFKPVMQKHHHATKLRVRKHLLRIMRECIDGEITFENAAKAFA